MEKLFRTNSGISIKEIEAIKFTENSYWYASTDYNGKEIVKRRSKFSSYEKLWDSKKEASIFLKDRTSRAIAHLEEHLKSLKEDLIKLNNPKQP
jgi:hypothetical protein